VVRVTWHRLWAINTAALWAALIAQLAGWPHATAAAVAWLAWFAAQEYFGWRQNVSTGTSGRTWSEWNQVFADADPGARFPGTLLGLDLFVTLNALAAGALLGLSAARVTGNWLGSAASGAALALLLYLHWQDNRRWG
jgi:hypothetical protein